MPIFEYTAVNSQGKQAKGTVDAENIRAARQKLRQQAIFPTDIRESAATRQAVSQDVKKLFRSDRVSIAELSVATRQLATLCTAGLPLVNALQALSDQTESLAFKRIWTDVREKVEEGAALAKALDNRPKIFPRLFVNMVASGEASGTLDTVLNNLADYLEAQLELRRKVSSALMYPILMLCVCVLVVLMLLAFVVPRIVEIFQKQGATLPLPTRILIATSNLVLNYWYVAVLAVIGAVLLLRWYYRQERGRSRIDHWVLRVPVAGPLYVKICTARVARTLGALLSSGVGLLTGLEITRNIIANVHVIKALEDARDGVREGRSLAREFSKSGIFPPLLWHMVAVGEKSGQLEEMLGKAGRSYESEVNTALAGMTRLIEPLMMIGVGIVVLCIVLSILMPMTDLMNVVLQ